MTMARSNDKDSPCYVLYVDHAGHPAPLTECFYATASRRLSSTIDRIGRPSTITQVDSAYCPQCLSFHDASSAAQLGYCPKPSCVRCPACQSIISCRKIEGLFCYACGQCDWKSTQCHLTVEASSSEGEIPKEEVEQAVTKLAEMLTERRQAGGAKKAAEAHYRRVVAGYEYMLKPESLSSKASARTTIDKKGGEAWSVEDLEKSMKEKQEALAVGDETINSLFPPVEHIDLNDKKAQQQTIDPDLAKLPPSCLSLQSIHTGAPCWTMMDLLPLPVPLRARKSRRCRAELADGKPGILLKPKLNPLEGDSSLRTGHGQWWKKDSSAVHVLPKVRVLHHGSKVLDGTANNTTEQHAFLIKITNPTLGLVRLQLGMSSYTGELFWDDDDNEDGKMNPVLRNLLIDTLSCQYVNAFLLTSQQPSDALTTELVELDSAEDAMVDFGKTRETPAEVSGWTAEAAMSAASSPSLEVKETEVTFLGSKCLAQQSGSAWFEVVCVTSSSSSPDVASERFPAIPLALKIEVGNGSWESSLIQANEEGEGPDLVSFDLLLSWPSSAEEKANAS